MTVLWHQIDRWKLAVVAGFALALVGLSGHHAQAQMAGPRISPPTPAGTPTSRTITVTVNKARIIDLPVAVRDVLLADPGIAQLIIKSPTRIYLVGRRIGSTNAFFFDADGREVFRADLTVAQDIELVKRAIRELMPDIEVGVTTVNNNIFLTGRVRSAEISENVNQIASRASGGAVVNLLEIIEDQQVMLRVRISEVRRSALKQIGINLFQIVASGFDKYFSYNLAVADPIPPANAFGNARFRYGDGTTAFNLAMNALEANGLTRTLAEPNLIAISGESASFLAGGELPIPVTSANGAISIQFQPFGVQLSFTPLVLNSGRIRLTVMTEVSSLDFASGVGLPGGSVVPAISTKRAQTVVELPSGGSMMMAGLLDDNISTNVSGVPGLKDVPILGGFFRNNSLQRNENELVVMVTALLVKPVLRRDRLKEPIDRVAPPSDYDLYALGQIQALYAPGENRPLIKELRGPIGYVVR